MRRRNSASFATPIYVARDTSSVSWGYFILTVVCSCVLAAGFFLAAKQHFNTMDYGMKNSKLRKQVEGLETEKRRLLLAREVSLSPAEIKRSARNLGFRARGEMAAAQTVVQKASVVGSTRNAGVSVVASKKPDDAKPVKAAYAAAEPKDAVDSKNVKKIVSQRATKDVDLRQTVAAR